MMNSNSSLKHAAFASLLFLSMILVFMFLGCGDGSSQAPVSANQAPVSGNDQDGNQPPVVNVELECEVEGYPCTLAEVPDEIRERSLSLANEALAMIANGASMDEVRDWLNQQDGMVEIMSDDLALRFRLEGGRGTWIFRKEALSDPGPGTTVPASVGLGAETLIDQGAAAPESVGLPTRSNLLPSSVVGPEFKSKRALVLAPVYYDFPGNHGPEQVAAILSSTRGYENGVTYLFNETSLSKEVTISNFKDWQNYQVIHVDSHGAVVCKAGSCRAVLVIGTLAAANTNMTEEERTDLPDNSSVEVVVIEDKLTGYIGLNADFFRKNYPGGLSDTLVFFNTCENAGSQATDLVDTIRGSTSVFVGWNGKVVVPDSNATVSQFYQELSIAGVTVQEAYNRLGDLQTDRNGAQLIPSPRAVGGDLRIRDIVYLLNPDTSQILTPSQEVSIVGEMDDGEPDIVPYRVRVDGILPQNAADAQLYVSVDGIVSEPQPVSDGEPGGPDSKIINGQLDLPYDVEQPMSVDFKAWVELPETGESSHETAATLTGLLSGEGIVGIWVVDNASIAFEPMAFTLDYIQGEIRVTFRADGSMEVVYNNHEYKVHADRVLSVLGVDIAKHEEFTHTANAQGSTTYEVNGDEIIFNNYSSESSFVDGTETVHHIATFDPPGYILPGDIDEVIERSYGGWGLFGGITQFKLSASGSTMQFLNGDKVTAILDRVGSAGG
jgi:hypothetical protein